MARNRILLRWVVLGQLAVFACGPARPSAARPVTSIAQHANVKRPDPAPPAQVASAEPPVAATVDPPVDCFRLQSPNLLQEQDPTLVQEVFDTSTDASPWAVAECEKLRAALEEGSDIRCFQSTPSGSGMWVVTTFPSESEGDSLSWQLSFLDGGGTRIRDGRRNAGNGGDPAIAGNASPSLPNVLSVVDYDGDGQQEVVTVVGQWIDAGNRFEHTVEVLTIRRGKVDYFDATRNHRIVNVEDRNGDRRPELVIDPHEGSFGSASGWYESSELWSLLVEIDPSGKPHNDGPASRDYARGLCPSPDGLLKELSRLDDYACVAGYIHCARLWAIPTNNILAALERLCAVDDLEELGWCSNSLTEWQSMAHASMPFTLER